MKPTHPPHWTSRQATIVIPRRRGDLIAEELDDEVILLDPQDGATHRLNATALDVWRRCDGQATTREVAAELTQTYEVTFETALDHVDQLLVSFAELGMLEDPCN